MRLRKDILGYLLLLRRDSLSPDLYFISLIRPLSLTVQGETIPFLKTLLFRILSVYPVATRRGPFFTGCLEALGAFLGGIFFVYIISGRIHTLLLSPILGFLRCKEGI